MPTVPVQPKQIRSAQARFTGTANVPALSLLGTNTVTFTVTPVTPNDSLAVGEPVTAHSLAADLPAGIIVGQARVVGTNSVKLTFYAFIALALATSVNWTIVAQR